jgi:hypothetical protein
MKMLPIALSGVALLALAACSESKVETAEPQKEVSIDLNSDKAGDSDQGMVNIEGDTESGKVELKLPGGIEANVKVPEGVVGKTDFDIDGVGLYPGAKVGAVNVKAISGNSAGKGTATVKIGFSAPADAAAVADWYQQQFEAKKIAVSRSGETLTGKTSDGDDFILALQSAGTGASKGQLTLVDGPDAG